MIHYDHKQVTARIRWSIIMIHYDHKQVTARIRWSIMMIHYDHQQDRRRGKQPKEQHQHHVLIMHRCFRSRRVESRGCSADGVEESRQDY